VNARSETKRNDRAGAEEAPARGRGRPRSEKADQAILAATLRMVGEHGVAATTIEGVAAEAGVGKTTIYRRFESKTELIIAAVSQMAPEGEPPDTGSVPGDLAAFADVQRERVARTGLMTVAPRVLAESMNDPELHQGFLDNVINPLRGAIRTILERGVERGQLRKDLDVDALVDILHAVPIYLILTSRADPSALDRVPSAYLPLLAPGIVNSSSEAPRSAPRRSSGSSRARRARSA
jgi:AcrR family transcriptional regulator